MHCLNRNCLRGSPAGDRETALLDPTTFRPEGCECGCWRCDVSLGRAGVTPGSGPSVFPGVKRSVHWQPWHAVQVDEATRNAWGIELLEAPPIPPTEAGVQIDISMRRTGDSVVLVIDNGFYRTVIDAKVVRVGYERPSRCTFGGNTVDKQHCPEPAAERDPMPDYCLAHYASALRNNPALGPEELRKQSADAAEKELLERRGT